ncbi:uncharacterized protein LOC119602771 isoform X2 [Lucilia sericata]|uniref:uncharacterized protein LOC119602771 isoform X2 n=1 Tax=Lucilia sericata TaxID=13632 RepID=UPI0018A85A63|nr:uncharacterized protein LOC119602771 isoform X2 [Lucilia sericata]
MGSIDKACISGFLCRLCSEMHRIVIHIYGDQGQRLCLVEKINGYLPITISPTDPLPKTICTTCLRRVEQHYDLLMRLSRIKKERFLRFNNKRPRVSPISSIENSEDEVYQSDDESRRRRQQLDIPPQRQMTQSQQHFLSTPAATTVSSLFSATTAESFSTSSSMNTASSSNDHGNEDDDVDDDDSGASTSASALAAITQTITAVNDTNIGDSTSSSSTSSSTHPLSAEGGSSFGIVLQQNTD